MDYKRRNIGLTGGRSSAYPIKAKAKRDTKRTSFSNSAMQHGQDLVYSDSKRMSVQYAGPTGPLPKPQPEDVSIEQEAGMKTFLFVGIVIGVIVFVISKL